MAEFKTYTCDRCGEQGAIHLEVPGVDYHDDEGDGRRQDVSGFVDLCVKHLTLAFPQLFKDMDRESRRALWKHLLSKT